MEIFLKRRREGLWNGTERGERLFDGIKLAFEFHAKRISYHQQLSLGKLCINLTFFFPPPYQRISVRLSKGKIRVEMKIFSLSGVAQEETSQGR